MVSTSDISYLVSQMQELVQTVSNATSGTGMGAGADTSEREKSAWKKVIKQVEQIEREQKGTAKSQKDVSDSISATEKAHQDYIKRATKDAKTTAETVRDLHKSGVTSTNKTASETLHNVDTLLQASSTLFQQTTDPMSNKQLNKSLVKFSSSLSKVDEQYGKQIKSLSDLYQVQKDLQNAQRLSARARTLMAEGWNTESIKENLSALAKQFGASSDVIKMFRGDLNEAITKSDNLQKSFDNVNQELAKTTGGLSAMNINIATSAYWLKNLAEEFASTAQAVARHGGQLENFLGSSLWGMTSEELSELQGQYRQTTLAFRSGAGSIDAWEQRVEQSRWQMAAFTGGLKESIQMNSQLVDLQRTLGDVSGNTASYLSDQQGMFKNWNRVFGMTVDQFMAMNEQLMQSQNVRSQLYKMDQQRRTAYFKDLQLTYQRLRSQGLLHEQAMQTVEALSELGGQDAKTRLEQSAKLAAVMSATGMGARSQEAASLLRGGLRGEGDQQRFSQIMGQASKQISDQMAAGFQQELVLGEMIKGTGLEKMLGPQSAFADVEIQRGKALMKNISATENLTQELTGVRKQLEIGNNMLIQAVAGGSQMTSNLLSGPIGTVLAGAGQIGATAIGARIGLSGMSGLAGSAAGAGKGILSGLTQGFGAKGAKGAAPLFGKGLARFIPGVGLALGGGAAINDLMQGDMIGAGLNAVGGIASLFPGVGTAIAAGTMGADVAREYGGDQQTESKQQSNVLERMVGELEEIKHNTEHTRDVAEHTRKTNSQIDSQREQERQRKNELDKEQRKNKAKTDLNYPDNLKPRTLAGQ